MGIKYIGKCLVVEEEGKKILAVGDLHLGYEESLNESGVYVSDRMFSDMIRYFDLIFEEIGKVDKVVLLGDVKHNFGKILREEWKSFIGLVEYFEEKLREGGEVIVIKGNHDKIIEPIAGKKGVRVLDYFIFGKYCFLHGERDFKEIWDKKIKVWIIGHGHPAVKLKEGVKVESFKCFLSGGFKGKEVIVVPSFFKYVSGSDARECDLGFAWNFRLGSFRTRVVGDEDKLEVLDFGLLREI